MKQLCVCCMATAAFASVALAQDNVEGGWGALFGGNYANAHTTAFPIIFTPGEPVEVAWELDTETMAGIVAPWERQQIVFDADGNLYWQSHHNWWTSYSRVVSLDPNGNVRWTFAGADGEGLGHTSYPLTPIVGEDALYVHSYTIYEPDPEAWWESVRDHWFVYAVNKDDGSTIWATELDNEPLLCGDRGWVPNFTLLNGKIYTIGHPHSDGTRAVYVIDAATGAILHNQAIHDLPVGRETMDRTNLVAVENVFDGLTGLYGYWDGMVWGLQVDITTPANTAVVWADIAGQTPWYARKSTIYVEELQLIVAYGLEEVYGYEAFAFDPVQGDISLEWGDSDDGDTGYHAAGALGFFDSGSQSVPLYAGSWPGKILKYNVDEYGVEYAETLRFDEDNWGAPGQFMQILKNPADGHAIAVSSAGAVPEHVLMIDLDGDMTRLAEGPMYLDDIKLYAGPDTASLSLVWSEDFEGRTLGSLPGQGDWLDSSDTANGEGPALVVVDPVDADNQVAELSPVIGAESYEGVRIAVALPDANVYRVEYRQYLNETTQFQFLLLSDEADDPLSRPFTYGYDNTQRFYAIEGGDAWNDPTIQATDVWESVIITHDYVGEESHIVLGGVKEATTSWLEEDGVTHKSYYPTNKPNGFLYELSDTPNNTNLPPAVMVDYDPGVTVPASLDRNLTGGPLVGPDGKIYFSTWPISNGANTYTDPLGGRVYALKPYDPTICADANCDGAVNAFDIDPFVIALVSPDVWATQYDCSLLEACDINDDGAVNAFDIDPFVVALVSGGCQ